MPKINLDIKIGMKEIVTVAVSIPLVYEKLRKLKLKYDKKEQSVDRVIHDESGMLKPGDMLWDSEGIPWKVQ
jgi:hypothetical protein